MESTWTEIVRSARKVAGFPPQIVKSQKRTNTKRIRITRSILLGGEHVEKGSVHEVAKSIADDLIATGSALPLRAVWWAVAAIVAFGVTAVLWLCRARLWW
ncbi:MAG: hypothetical protein WAN12_18880 [Candidatus Acidiferrum sp.]